MRLVIFILFIFIQTGISAQIVKRDTLSVESSKSESLKEKPQAGYGLGYRVSKNAIEENILYGAVDSTMIDVKNKLIYLYGDSFLNYDDYKLTAGQIRIDFENDTAYAEFGKDTDGNKIGLPYFESGEQKLTAEKLKFNYKTKKGIVEGSRMKEGEFTILGGKTKFISKEGQKSLEDVVFQKDALITTCDHDHPHFGIRTKKIKIIPNRVAIIGFSQLEIAGVPTPLFLPYGLFPLTGGQSAGLIFPRNYEYDNELGFGLRGIGYYFPINDYMDLTLTGNIYTRGSHMINVATRYKKRYKYNGNVLLSYNNQLRENSGTGRVQSTKSFRLKLSHNQDRKAHPYKTFGGSIDIQTGDYQSSNYSDYSSQVRNILNSNFTYNDKMPGTPFNLSVSMSHNQNTQTHVMNVSLPTINLNMQTIYPFKNKNRPASEEKWYDKVNLSYNAGIKNYVRTVDSTFFSQTTIDKMVTGAEQNASMGANFDVLKYFKLSPNISAKQILTYKTKEMYLNQDPVIDTTGTSIDQNGETIYLTTEKYNVEDRFNTGFKTYNSWDAGLTLSTQIFGTKRWRKGWLRGVRHTIKPNVTVNYANDTEHYLREYYTHPDSLASQLETYSPFNGGAYNPTLRPQQLGMSYNITNFFEAKYYSKKDEKEKSFSPIRQLNIRGNYNYAKDSIQWSPVYLSTGTELFKGITRITANAQYNVYKKNKNGAFIQRTVWEEDKKLLEFNNLDITVSNSFTVKRIAELFSKKPTREESKKKQEGGNDVERTVNDGIDLYQEAGAAMNSDEQRSQEKGDQRTFYDYIKDFSFYHSWRYAYKRNNDGKLESNTTTHTIGVSGRVPLTDNWNIVVGNISYDINSKKFVYPDLRFERDLHCWSMQLSWQPYRGTYGFFIGVKSSNLSFLKYNYGRQLGGVGSGGFFNR